MVFSACWNLVEKFQMSTPRTTSAIQNNRLFNVEFTRKSPLGAQPSGLPKFQDYHGLRGVGYPKSLVNSVSGDPHNPIGFVDHQRDGVAGGSRDFSIHEVVLQLLAPVQPHRVKPVAGTTISYGQTSAAEVAPDEGQIRADAFAHHCTRSDFRRDRPARIGPHNLSWDRQRKAEKVRGLLRRP